MPKPLLIAAAAAVLAVSAAPAALAQGGASNKAAGSGEASTLTPEQEADVRRASQIQRAFSEVLKAEEVSTPVKGALLLCLYNNKLSTISQATERVLTNNPGLDANDPVMVYRAAAGVCGVTFRPVDGEAGKGDAAKPAKKNDIESR